MATDRKVRVAIVGLGFGAEFIPIYQAHPNAEMYAVCRRNKAELDTTADRYKIARRYATDHHVRRVDPNSFELIDRLASIYDEPFGDSSAMPTFRVAAMARENVTVALSGDGGDEVFAGYRRYRWHCFEERVRRLVPQSIRSPLFGILGRLYPKFDRLPRVFRAKATFQELSRDPFAAPEIGTITVLQLNSQLTGVGVLTLQLAFHEHQRLFELFHGDWLVYLARLRE